MQNQFVQRRGLGKVALSAAFLGTVFGMHIVLLAFSLFSDVPRWYLFRWAIYMLSMCVFHFGEFAITARWRGQDVSDDSFLLNHSTAYKLAAVASWVEFWIRQLVFSNTYKTLQLLNSFALFFGILFISFGYGLRAIAMWQAGSSFTHLVSFKKESSHKLVTHGVYKYFRHPSYVGWFVWSVGTQLVLGNPLCIVAYVVASWMFFAERIPPEETALISFFGAEYANYARKTFMILPFIESPALAVTPEEADQCMRIYNKHHREEENEILKAIEKERERIEAGQFSEIED